MGILPLLGHGAQRSCPNAALLSTMIIAKFALQISAMLFLGVLELVSHQKCGWSHQDYETVYYDCLSNQWGNSLATLINVTEMFCRMGVVIGVCSSLWDLGVLQRDNGFKQGTKAWAESTVEEFDLDSTLDKCLFALMLISAPLLLAGQLAATRMDDPPDWLNISMHVFEFFCHATVMAMYCGMIYQIVCSAFKGTLLFQLDRIINCITGAEDNFGQGIEGVVSGADEENPNRWFAWTMDPTDKELTPDEVAMVSTSKIVFLWVMATNIVWAYLLHVYNTAWASDYGLSQFIGYLQGLCYVGIYVLFWQTVLYAKKNGVASVTDGVGPNLLVAPTASIAAFATISIFNATLSGNTAMSQRGGGKERWNKASNRKAVQTLGMSRLDTGNAPLLENDSLGGTL